MLVIGAFLLVVVGASVRGLRRAGEGTRWPFLVALTLSGGATLTLVMATVIALISGRDTWNDWVSGSPSSEAATLWVVLIAGPALLAACVVLLMIGVVLRNRQRGRSGQPSSTRPTSAPPDD